MPAPQLPPQCSEQFTGVRRQPQPQQGDHRQMQSLIEQETAGRAQAAHRGDFQQIDQVVADGDDQQAGQHLK